MGYHRGREVCNMSEVQPPGGPPPEGPKGPKAPKAPKAFSKADQDDAFLLKSPFAKMFRAAGATPTVKQIKAIINGILKNILNEMKRAQAEQKKADEKLKRVIRGEE